MLKETNKLTNLLDVAKNELNTLQNEKQITDKDNQSKVEALKIALERVFRKNEEPEDKKLECAQEEITKLNNLLQTTRQSFVVERATFDHTTTILEKECTSAGAESNMKEQEVKLIKSEMAELMLELKQVKQDRNKILEQHEKEELDHAQKVQLLEQQSDHLSTANHSTTIDANRLIEMVRTQSVAQECTMISALKKTQEKNESLKEKNRELSKDLIMLRQKHAEIKVEEEKVNAEIELARESALRSESALNVYRAKQDVERQEHLQSKTILTEENKQITMALEKMQVECHQLKVELKQVHSKYNSSTSSTEKSTHTTTVQQLEATTKINKLKSHVEQLMHDLKVSRNEMNDMEIRLHSTQKYALQAQQQHTTHLEGQEQRRKHMETQRKESEASRAATMQVGVTARKERLRFLEKQVQEQHEQIRLLDAERNQMAIESDERLLRERIETMKKVKTSELDTRVRMQQELDILTRSNEQSTAKTERLESSVRSLKLEISNCNTMLETSREETAAKSNELTEMEQHVSKTTGHLKGQFLLVKESEASAREELEQIRSNWKNVTKQLKKSQHEIEELTEQISSDSKHHQITVRRNNAQWEEKTLQIQQSLEDSTRRASVAEVGKKHAEAMLHKQQLLVSTKEELRSSSFHNDIQEIKDMNASMRFAANEMVKTSVNAMSLTHRAQMESVQSAHAMILQQHISEHISMETRLRNEIMKQEERIKSIDSELLQLRQREHEYFNELSSHKETLRLTQGDAASLKQRVKQSEELEQAYHNIKLQHESYVQETQATIAALQNEHKQALASQMTTMTELETTMESVMVTKSQSARGAIVLRVREQATQLVDISNELIALKSQVLDMEEESAMQQEKLEHSLHERNRYEAALADSQQRLLNMETVFQQRQQEEEVQGEEEEIINTYSPSATVESLQVGGEKYGESSDYDDDDDGFEDALEPITVSIPPQITAQVQTTSFFTPQKQVLTEQEALFRVRQKIVGITARKWRDENVVLKQQLEALSIDNAQLEDEGNDLMAALESAQKLENELAAAKRMAGIISMSRWLIQKSKDRSRMETAFRQMDRYRWCAKVKDKESEYIDETQIQGGHGRSNVLFTTPTNHPRSLEVTCTECVSRRTQVRDLMLNLNDHAYDLEWKLRSLKSSAVSNLLDQMNHDE
jgi:hypothetical protein